MAEYASKGVAGSGLGLSIANIALGVLNSFTNSNGLCCRAVFIKVILKLKGIIKETLI